MKAAFTLGALAAFCQSAFSLREGTYTIGSASLVPSLVLGETRTDGGPLEFTRKNGHPGQTWFFEQSSSDDRYFNITNTLGGSISCGSESGSLCFPGGDPVTYAVEFVGDSLYELVDVASGYFLGVNEQRDLELAAYSGSPSIQFTLTSTA